MRQYRVGIAIAVTVAVSGFAARVVASTWTCRTSLGSACAVTSFVAPNKVTVETPASTRSMTISVFRDGAPYTSFVTPTPGPIEIDCIGCEGAAVCIDADGCAGNSAGLTCLYVSANGTHEDVHFVC